MEQKYKDFLIWYTGDFEYLKNVRDYYKRHRKLSAKQMAAVIKCYHKTHKATVAAVNSTPKGQTTVTLKEVHVQCNVDVVTRRSWGYAIMKNEGLPFPAICITISKILKQTAKAYLIEYSPTVGDVSVCRCCGKDLTDDRSRATKLGPICAKRYKIPYITDLREVLAWKKEWEKVCINFGTRTAWIPKRAIKTNGPTVASLAKALQQSFNPTGLPSHSTSTIVPHNIVTKPKSNQNSLIEKLRLLYKNSIEYGNPTYTEYIRNVGKLLKSDPSRKLTSHEAEELNIIGKVIMESLSRTQININK